MKNLASFIFSIIICTSIYAQVPEKMSYQAVVRNAKNELVINKNIGIQISILASSISGTTVFEESHTVKSNANGLVSFEIGTGTAISGAFGTIGWSQGLFFIKTEIDPLGGTNYTITSNSQLQTVPFAMHSNTADSLIGGITVTESDPVFTASLASSITIADTANWNTHTVDTDTHIDSAGIASLGFRGDTQLDSASIATMGFTAGPHTDSLAIANMGYRTPISYQIGDFAFGGVVFWVDHTGQHGLVCAKEDQNAATAVRWHNGSYSNTWAKGNGLGAGAINTAIVVPTFGTNTVLYAIGIALHYSSTVNGVQYGGWYLPSRWELTQLYQNRSAVNTSAASNGGAAFQNGFYWSSTEVSSVQAHYRNFTTGVEAGGDKATTHFMRAVRQF